MSDRRSFLRGLVTLPLIGGGVTLIGAPSAPVPLIQAAALPTFDDPRQRARYAWEAFSDAIGDLTSGSDAWTVSGFGRITPIPHYKLPSQTHCGVKAVRYVYRDTGDPNRPGVYEETDYVDFLGERT